MSVKVIPHRLMEVIGGDRETYRFFLEIADTTLTTHFLSLNVTRITSADSPYTVTSDDRIIMADTDGGAISVGLGAGYNGRSFSIKNVGSSDNSVTINPDGTETIFGDPSLVIYDGEVIDITWEETENWR